MGIDAQTRLFCVLGDPVAHSLSPVMHNAAFGEGCFNQAYLAFRVTDIAKAVSALEVLGIGGASITLPHKIGIMPYLDEVDDAARAIGAVNTVINRQGRLIGANSDWQGAMTALGEVTQIKGKTVAIIGAGGAARAIAYGVRQEGGHLIIVNRTREKGKKLAAEFGGTFFPLDAVEKVQCDVFVNTTAVGMTPVSAESPVPGDCLQPGQVVMDIVYNPLETVLLQQARDRGCTVVDGLAMFVHQGALQFEWWTGCPAPLDLMRRAVAEKLSDSRG